MYPSNSRRVQVAIAGLGTEPVPDKVLQQAVKLVDNIARCDPVIIVGGYWGIMRVIVDEALKKGLTVVMVLPEDKCDVRVRGAISICSGMGFRERSSILVRSSDVVVALGGEVGTITEILLAYSYGIPVYVLRGTGLSTDKLEDDWSPHVDTRRTAIVKYFDDVSEITREICKPG